MLWLAHTDADTHVPPDWLTRQLHYAALGYDAVAGVVDVDSFDEYPLDVIDAFAERYGTGLTGHHTHVHGANLGVRASAYRRVGGWPAMALSEDHGL